MTISVFDFDGTIFKKDSFITFCIYTYKKKPWRMVYIFLQIYWLILFKIRTIDAFTFKNRFLKYLDGLSSEEMQELTKNFWAQRRTHDFNQEVLKKMHIEKEAGSLIVCISASPSFLLEKMVKDIGVDYLICTPSTTTRNKTILTGKNCRGAEKIFQLGKHFPQKPQISLAISDNEDDMPLLQLAQKKIKIVKSKLISIK